MTELLEWRNETRRLGDLTKWPNNPKYITKENAARLVESYKEFGQPEPLIIGPDDEVYNGNQRSDVWLEAFGEDFVVDVRVASRKLTEKEKQKYTILSTWGATGSPDFEVLGNLYEVDDLKEYGFPMYLIDGQESDRESFDPPGS